MLELISKKRCEISRRNSRFMAVKNAKFLIFLWNYDTIGIRGNFAKYSNTHYFIAFYDDFIKIFGG